MQAKNRYHATKLRVRNWYFSSLLAREITEDSCGGIIDAIACTKNSQISRSHIRATLFPRGRSTTRSGPSNA